MTDDHLIIDTHETDSVADTADFIEAALDSPDAAIALPILHGTPPTDRRNLIDHHDRVVAELRRRGVPVHAYTQPKPDGVALVIALATP